MDHDDVREQLELAAVEPDGLDRLMAGDTATAAAIAGHLAGCDACTTELERLRRGVPLLRDVVRTSPPADLRERTLAYVRDRGVPRGPSVAVAAAVPGNAGGEVVTDGLPSERRGSRRLGAGTLPWVAAIAAAVAISVAATAFLVGSGVDRQLAQQADAVRDLSAVTVATLDVTAEPDAERVALRSSDGSPPRGSLVFSPSTTELVVVATGLAAPPAGQEYRCWVEVGGKRQRIGRMFFGGDIAYWVGDVPVVAAVPAGSQFGVSLTTVGGGSLDADPVIAGTL
jgi:Anti-sigma-K factor rskA, C-terminal